VVLSDPLNQFHQDQLLQSILEPQDCLELFRRHFHPTQIGLMADTESVVLHHL
jgi:hypothetical protein